jgi:mannose/fructose/N-acetylgalactosamine-specific phosphotransferase system component IID
MYLVAIGWMYVVLMIALAEAMSAQGTVLGAVITFVMWGVLPLSLLLYILGTPGRKRARRAAEEQEAAAASEQVDRGGHAAGDPVAPERKEP